MTFNSVWTELRHRCEEIESDSVLVTPSSERAFSIESSHDDRINVTYVENNRERPLWRNQFEVLHDWIESESGELSIAELPAGVEPYVSVMSLSERYTVDESEETLHRSESTEPRESPFLRPEWTARTPPQRVYDNAVLLADTLQRHDLDDLGSLSSEELVDLYVLLSDVQRGADRLRKTVGDVLLEYIGPGADLHGRFGTVHRTSRKRRHLKDEKAVLNVLDEEGVPREWVWGIDPEKLDVVLAVTDIDERDVYNVEEQVYVQKTSVEEAEKQSQLQGLKDRLAGLDTEEAEDLRDDIEELEERLDTVLAAG